MEKENIDPDDLLGNIVPEINPKKLFDEKEYVTLVVGGEEKSKMDILISDCISILTSNKTTREEKDEALATLKEKKAQAYLIEAIKKTKNDAYKTQLIAACWEAGLDFSPYFSAFIDFVCDKNFAVSLEAFTVIQEMGEEIETKLLNESLKKLKKIIEPSITITDAIELIENKLKPQ